jgi:hypothetical protein
MKRPEKRPKDEVLVQEEVWIEGSKSKKRISDRRSRSKEEAPDRRFQVQVKEDVQKKEKR